MIEGSLDSLRPWFEAKINKNAENGCWIWTAGKNDMGYGIIKYHDIRVKAHRLAMHFYKNFDLNSHLQVNHKPKCNNPSCVNPDHMYLGTQSENMRDAVIAGTNHQTRKTHCPQGHEYSGTNLFYTSNGGRSCRICSYYSKKKYQENKKEKMKG